MGVPTFGDKVRIKATDETQKHGSAGQLGEVLGESVPSDTGLDFGSVVGGTAQDRLLFVKLDSGLQGWFAPALVEFVDHQTGSVMSIDGGPTFRRLPDGSWQQDGDPTQVGDFLNPTGGVPRRPAPGAIAAFLHWLRQQRKT